MYQGRFAALVSALRWVGYLGFPEKSERSGAPARARTLARAPARPGPGPGPGPGPEPACGRNTVHCAVFLPLFWGVVPER